MPGVSSRGLGSLAHLPFASHSAATVLNDGASTRPPTRSRGPHRTPHRQLNGECQQRGLGRRGRKSPDERWRGCPLGAVLGVEKRGRDGRAGCGARGHACRSLGVRLPCRAVGNRQTRGIAEGTQLAPEVSRRPENAAPSEGRARRARRAGRPCCFLRDHGGYSMLLRLNYINNRVRSLE